MVCTSIFWVSERLTNPINSGYYLAFGKDQSSLHVLQSNDDSKLGTCAMKPRERGGVVDSKLNVYGVKGLKVAGQSKFTSTSVENL